MGLSRFVLRVAGSLRLSNPRISAAFTIVLCGALIGSVAPAQATRNHIFSGTIGSPGSGAGELSSPEAVAVDNSTGPAAGDVYVADTGNARVDQFEADGHFVRAWGWGVADGKEEFEICTTQCQKGIQPTEPAHSQPGQFDTPAYIAVDRSSGPSIGDVYVADNGTGLVQKFNSSGELITTWGNNGPLESANGQLNGANATPTPNPYVTVEGPFRSPFNGIAIDNSGHLWVFDGNAFMFEFDEFGVFDTSWYPEIAGHSGGLAVDSFENVYLDGNYDRVEKFSSTGSILSVLSQNGTAPTGLAVSPLSNELYVDEHGRQIGRIASSCEPPTNAVCPIVETFGFQRLNGATGLAVRATSETVYATEPTGDVLDIFILEPPSSPRIEGQTVSFVTSGSATFNAGVNPRGVSSRYRFEYGPTTSYGESVPIPDGEVGVADFEVDEVSAHVQDLRSATTYHFRVVAGNADGTAYGSDQTFTTQTIGGVSGLPDGRSWELVTPPDKHGALFNGQSEGFQAGGSPNPFVAEASVDGEAMINLATQPTEDEPEGNSNNVSVFSSRGPGGWSSQVIAPPHDEGTAPSIGSGGEYRFFSEDLSHGVLQPFSNFTPLSPEASESTAYLRTDYMDGSPGEHCLESCYQPLVTANNTKAGAVFGEETGVQCGHFICGPRFVDATPDLHHVILSSPAQLTSTPTTEGGLYEWSEGRLQLISVLPAGEEGKVELAGLHQGARHAISDDGSRVILVSGGHLYLRDVTKDETVRLDIPQGGGVSSVEMQYMTASSDASRIFFLDRGNLTSESSISGPDLYEYNVNAPPGDRLTDLTVDKNANEPANIRRVLGVSKDGSYVYFVAAGALSEDAEPGICGLSGADDPPVEPGKESCNVYVRHDGTTRLVTAHLAAAESGETSARVSPDGQWLTFMANGDLTSYDTHDAVSGNLDQEVYLYNASSDKLVCASCNPTGARPVGTEMLGGLVYGNLPGKAWVASELPQLTSFEDGESRYAPRALSDSGRLFFNSHDALVPQDVNGTWDVYEYEPVGVGSCSTGSVIFGEHSDGCVGLISSGASAEESAFMDASATGGDAFFITLSKLVPQDYDNALDVYDAHECTSVVPCYPVAPASPPACSTGDSCKAAPTPQPSIFGPAASATFSGVGNVSASLVPIGAKQKTLTRAQKLARALGACHRRKLKQRGVCERKARKRYGAISRSRKSSVKQKGRG